MTAQDLGLSHAASELGRGITQRRAERFENRPQCPARR